MLNSVLQHVKSVVDGLAVPGQSVPVTARVVPPPVEPMSDAPIAYVTLAGRAKGKRQTMPRYAGFTEIDWPVGITVDFPYPASAPDIDQAFYLISDAILAALWADPMPVFITDLTTQAQTQMTAIGEDYTVQVAGVVAVASNRLYLFRGMVETTVREKAQTGPYLGSAVSG